jgi:hypothetical protein
MVPSRRFIVTLLVGLAGSLLLASIYFGLVSIAESRQHALEFFWQDRGITIPIILGFGVQSALHTILKMRWFQPVHLDPVQKSDQAVSG